MFKALIVLLAATIVSARNDGQNLIFTEDFDGEDDVFTSGKWIKSTDEKYQDQPIMVKPPTKSVNGFEGDKGVQLTQEMKHYGFGARFFTPLLFDKDEVVIQYELKLEERLNCGGAYIKLLRNGAMKLEQLNNESPYTIMFGPDKCGTDSRLHFILKYKNPVTKMFTEHHYDGHIKPKIDRSYHVYTLVLRKDNTFEVFIDTKSVAQGSLLHNLTPPINPPAEIDDPRDFKPSTWIGQPMMYDTSAVKPEDWDESQPKKIVDIHATKPDTWDETVPVTVPDPAVSKPSDWDDEEDGAWEAPQVSNPLCDTVGCGPWTAPLIRNPLYKGKWVPPIVPNPEYKGPWAPRKIPNANYFYEPNPYRRIAPMYAVAVEVWTISAGILFDNFHIGHSLTEALAHAKNTTGRKAHAEKAVLDKENDELDLEARLEVLETGTLVERLSVRVEMAVEHLRENPKMFFYALAAFVFTVVYSRLVGGGQNKECKKVKRSKKSVEEVVPLPVMEEKIVLDGNSTPADEKKQNET